MKQRLDQAVVSRGLISSRSQAASAIRLGTVLVNGRPVTKSGAIVNEHDNINLTTVERYVSRAGLNLLV